MTNPAMDHSDSRIDKVALRKALGDRLLGQRLLYFLTVPSTNEHVRELAEDGWPEGTVVLAEEQTEGKGRAGRAWHSPPGLGLHLSILLKPSMAAEATPLLSLMAAVAGARALQDCGARPEIKWPNDLLLDGRKVGGILAEARHRPGAPPEVIVGIGLNVNHRAEDFPAEIRDRAGSVRDHLGAEQDRTAVLVRLLVRLDEAYAALRAGAASALLQEFETLAPMARGREVTVSSEEGPITGRSAGLAPDGALRIATASGLREVRAGDVAPEGSGAPGD